MIIILIIIIYSCLNLRYGLRYYILYALTLRRNVGFIWVTNERDAKKYLLSSNKGDFIETRLSQSAWKPILSLESENGENWLLLKERLLFLMKQLPNVNELTAIIFEHTNQRDVTITSKEIGVLTIRIFMQYLFGQFEPEHCNELYDASLQFRKEIALKGVGDIQKKIGRLKSYANIL